MSVLKRNRKESVVEFINTARELKLFSVKQCTKFPKRYTFYISIDIANSAKKIYQYVMRANDINPRNQHEAQIRRDYIMLAHGVCISLVSDIEDAQSLFGIPEKTLVEWMRLVKTELRLLNGVKKREAEKYKDLPDTNIPPIPISELE